MDAEKSVTTIDRHEWTLMSPAHHTEVEKAVAVAEHDRARLASRGVHTGDVHVHAADDRLVVSYEAARPKIHKRAVRGVTDDVEAPSADA